MTSHQVGVAAEAIAAGIFAQAGFGVAVQYGANQPGYDLMIEREKRAYLVSVKGSQDGAWGLTQSYLKNADYHAAVDKWLKAHGNDMIFCFVQFKGKSITEMPDIYLAKSGEVAEHLKHSGEGKGDTVLHISKTWKSGKKIGHTDQIPGDWKLSSKRIESLFPVSVA